LFDPEAGLLIALAITRIVGRTTAFARLVWLNHGLILRFRYRCLGRLACRCNGAGQFDISFDLAGCCRNRAFRYSGFSSVCSDTCCIHCCFCCMSNYSAIFISGFHHCNDSRCLVCNSAFLHGLSNCAVSSRDFVDACHQRDFGAGLLFRLRMTFQ
jgi:hypothetical protein